MWSWFTFNVPSSGSGLIPCFSSLSIFGVTTKTKISSFIIQYKDENAILPGDSGALEPDLFNEGGGMGLIVDTPSGGDTAGGGILGCEYKSRTWWHISEET